MAAALPSQVHENRFLGIGLRIAGVSCAGVMFALLKLGHELGLNIPELIFYRFAFSLLPLLAWMTLKRDFGAWRTRRPFLLLGCGVLSLVSSAVTYLGVTLLPLAEATTIGFSAPFFAIALSALLMAERVGLYRWSAVVLGFAGVLIVMQPTSSDLPRLGLVFALLGATGSGSSHVLFRYAGRTESAITSTIWSTIVITSVSGLLLPRFAEWHDPAEWLLLIVLGLTGGLAQLLMTASVRVAPVAAVVPFDYAQLVWAILLGWMLWDTSPATSTWVGAAVIIASGLATIYREHRRGGPPSRSLLQP